MNSEYKITLKLNPKERERERERAVCLINKTISPGMLYKKPDIYLCISIFFLYFSVCSLFEKAP